MSDTIGGVIKWIIIIVVALFLLQHFNLFKKQAGSVIWSATTESSCNTQKQNTQNQGHCTGNCVRLSQQMVDCLGFTYSGAWAYYWNPNNLICDQQSNIWKCLYSSTNPDNCPSGQKLVNGVCQSCLADYDCNNCVSTSELVTFINQWINNMVDTPKLIMSITTWTVSTC